MHVKKWNQKIREDNDGHFLRRWTDTKKTVHFGAYGYDDYTVPPHDEDKNARYIERHNVNENWNDCTQAGTLSRNILWSNKSITDAIKIYYTRFNLKKLKIISYTP